VEWFRWVKLCILGLGSESDGLCMFLQSMRNESPWLATSVAEAYQKYMCSRVAVYEECEQTPEGSILNSTRCSTYNSGISQFQQKCDAREL
jgi:hypothetical protein